MKYGPVLRDGSRRKPFSRLMRVIAASIALVIVAAACGDSGGSSSTGNTTNVSTTAAATTTLQPQAGGTLTFAAYSQIAGLDPLVALGNGTSGAIQMAAVYDTLM